MTAMPYAHEVKHVARALDLVRRATTPRTVSVRHLEANGFASPAGEQVHAFLRDLGLVEDDGTPSTVWAAYREADEPKTVLAAIVRELYAPLLEETADGSPTDAELERLVDDPERAALVVSTFRVLCDRAGIHLGPDLTTARPRRDVLQDVSALLQLSVSEFDAARACLANDLTRPAHVMAWNSFVALAFAHLSADDFAALRTRSDRRALPLNDLMRAVHGSELVRLLVTHGLVPADDKAAVDELLRLRNDCAQPFLFWPDRTETADYLSAILSRSALLSEHQIG